MLLAWPLCDDDSCGEPSWILPGSLLGSSVMTSFDLGGHTPAPGGFLGSSLRSRHPDCFHLLRSCTQPWNTLYGSGSSPKAVCQSPAFLLPCRWKLGCFPQAALTCFKVFQLQGAAFKALWVVFPKLPWQTWDWKACVSTAWQLLCAKKWLHASSSWCLSYWYQLLEILEVSEEVPGLWTSFSTIILTICQWWCVSEGSPAV